MGGIYIENAEEASSNYPPLFSNSIPCSARRFRLPIQRTGKRCIEAVGNYVLATLSQQGREPISVFLRLAPSVVS